MREKGQRYDKNKIKIIKLSPIDDFQWEIVLQIIITKTRRKKKPQRKIQRK